MKTKTVKVYCDQCQMLSINGIPCHEIGCPNMRARWDIDSQSWVRQYKCSECGCMADEGSLCCQEEEYVSAKD